MNTQEPGSNPRRMPRWAVYGLVALAVVLGVWMGVAMWKAGLRREMEAEAARSRAAGWPTTLAELDRWYTAVPDSENAALLYTNAIGLLEPKIPSNEDHPWKSIKLPGRREPLEEDVQKKMETALLDNASVLELAHRAASLERSRFPVDLTRMVQEDYFRWYGVHGISRLLCFEVSLAAETGNSTHAARALAANLALARSLQGAPRLGSWTLNREVEKAACQSLERAINKLSLTERELARLDQLIVQAASTNILVRALVGEKVTGSKAIESIPTGACSYWDGLGLPPIVLMEARAMKRMPGLMERERAIYLNRMGTLIKKASQPMHLSLKEMVIDDWRMRIWSFVRQPLAFYMTDDYGWDFKRNAIIQARLRCAHVALALERWRLAHGGALPESLPALVPAYLDKVPLDPCDGQPLRYRKLERGYRVYSIGTDLLDNGGLEPPGGKADQDGCDLTFTVER